MSPDALVEAARTPDLDAMGSLGLDVLAELLAGEGQLVHGRLAPNAQAAIPVEQLISAVSGLVAQLGLLTWVGSPTSGPASVMVPFRLGETDLALNVTTAPEGLTGVGIAPGHREVAWEVPAYGTADLRLEGIEVAGLPGEITLPSAGGRFPGVVLIHGSGPQDRDGTVGGAKPFRDIAYGLAARGIAVLRYDKRTYAAPTSMTSVTLEAEVFSDAREAVKVLGQHPDVDARRIVAAGHSLGGTCVTQLAVDGTPVAGIVLMAGSARPLEDVIVEQMTYLGTPRSVLDDLAPQVARVKELRAGATNVDGDLPLGVPLEYWKSLVEFDPVAALAGGTVPALLLQGERDYQVTLVDLKLFMDACHDRADVTSQTFPLANHLLCDHEGKPGPLEYEIPGQHVTPDVIDSLAAFTTSL